MFFFWLLGFCLAKTQHVGIGQQDCAGLERLIGAIVEGQGGVVVKGEAAHEAGKAEKVCTDCELVQLFVSDLAHADRPFGSVVLVYIGSWRWRC